VRNYHALSWLEYALLQRGRYRAARDTLGELEPVVKATGIVQLLSDLASMRARYAIETRRWDLMSREQNFANVNDLFAIGMSAARTPRAWRDGRRADALPRTARQLRRSGSRFAGAGRSALGARIGDGIAIGIARNACHRHRARHRRVDRRRARDLPSTAVPYKKT